MDCFSPSLSMSDEVAHDIMPLGNQRGEMRVSVVSDVDDQAANITAWYQVYDQIRAGTFYGAINEVWLGKLQFFLETTSHALRQSCVVWPGAFWFGLPRFDCDDAYIDAFPLNKNSIAVRPGGVDFELLTPDSFGILGIVIEEHVLERHACMAERPDLLDMLRRGEVFSISPERKAAFWRRLSQTMADAGKQDRLSSGAQCISDTACDVLAEDLVTGLIDLLSDAAKPPSPRQSSLNRHKVVSRARDYVLSRPDQVISVADLCENLYVSRRTLQNCFHEILGVCPVTYLKALRLNAVRRTLKDSASALQTVQDVAAAWGFWHMSQFAADYRNMFSELPSETLKVRTR